MDFFLQNDILIKIGNTILIIFIGYLIIQTIALLARKLLWRNLTKQSQMLFSKGITYTGYVIILFLVFRRLDFIKSFSALFGAAGVLGIIVGIASQTSIGNIVSGLFILSEKPFEIGDLIRVGDKLGTVYSVDLLAIKMKTLDNQVIRIPNQTIISTDVTNVTRFPIRRMDINVCVAYKEDLRKVLEILQKVAKGNPLCLDEPEPLVMVKNYGDSGINILFGIWFEKSNYVKVRNNTLIEIKEAFDQEKVEIPFPHVTLYTGETTKPFPVQEVKIN